MNVARLFLFAVCFLWTGSVAVAYTDHRHINMDSLEAVLRSPNPPKGDDLLRTYMTLMRGYESSDGQRCEEYARKTLALSYLRNALRSRQNALYVLGLMAYGRDEWDTAADYFQQSLAVVDSMRQDRRYTEGDVDDCFSQLYGALGNLYNMQDQLHLAIHYYQQALPIFERHGWLQSQTILYYNVGELYLSMGNTAEAEHNYSLALEKADESGDSLMMATSWLGLVKIYLNSNYDLARKTGEAAYQYYSNHLTEDPAGYVDILASLARLHLMEGHEDVKTAKRLTDEALAMADTFELMTETRCNVYAAACEVAMHEKRWNEALSYGLKSVHNDSVATYNDASCFVLLAKIYSELGDQARSYEYIDKVYDVMQRYATDHYQSGLSQMRVLYDTDRKQAAIEQLKREKQWLTWGGLLAACVLLLLVLLFFLLWRSSRLHKRNALIKAKLDGEVAERIRIARDLHDRLGGTLTALRLAIAGNPEGSDASDTSNITELSRGTALSLTDAAISEMRNVAHHLLPDSLVRYGLRVALRDYCQALKNVSFAFVGEEHWLEPSQAEDLYCIVHELVNNAVKSANANHIMVQLLAAEDYTAVNVSDDGNGLPDEKEAKGIGFDNIRARAEALGGTLTIYSKPGEGTEINLEVHKP